MKKCKQLYKLLTLLGVLLSFQAKPLLAFSPTQNFSGQYVGQDLCVQGSPYRFNPQICPYTAPISTEPFPYEEGGMSTANQICITVYPPPRECYNTPSNIGYPQGHPDTYNYLPFRPPYIYPPHPGFYQNRMGLDWGLNSAGYGPSVGQTNQGGFVWGGINNGYRGGNNMATPSQATSNTQSGYDFSYGRQN